MAPGIEVTAEDLKVFLQETEEQLQLLDEDLIRLEKEADNAELLQEIFRAAHTIKGSSGMLGFHKMAELTHAMEDVLDRLCKGTLTVTSEFVDALLASLDGLKVLKENLNSPEGEALDIEPLMATLRAITEGDGGLAFTGESGGTLEALVSDPAMVKDLRAAVEDGLNLWRVDAVVDKESAWAAVRLFQVLNELSRQGKIVVSVPSREEIEDEKVGYEFQAIIATSQTADDLRPGVESVEDVQSISIEPWRGQGEAVAEASASDSRQGQIDASGQFRGGRRPEGESDRRVIDLGPQGRGKQLREQLETTAHKVETLQTVRIDVERLDALMNMVGELVIDQTRINQISRVLQCRYGEDDLLQALGETSAHIVKVVGELNESMMQVRMLPIGLLFNKFPRLVRDLARSTGKSVDFVVEGEETEIDRTVIEKIKDPLVHLIRNAVDHGIERPETRRAAGKPETGLVKLSARHDQGYIIITLEEDGKGIDVQRVKESAVRKGIISGEIAERLSDAETLELVFEAGVSTAEKTTEVSGRGVGMDVVRREIQALNGLAEVDTSVGNGTTFTLRLPLTLATFSGLLVESAKIAYAIPLRYVQETVRTEPNSITTVMGRRVMNLRGKVMPLLRLSTICGTGSENGDRGDDNFVVVVKAGERPVAVGVDALIEHQEIVVKSLGGYVGQAKGITGASILGDGQVVLILDVAALMKAASHRES